MRHSRTCMPSSASFVRSHSSSASIEIGRPRVDACPGPRPRRSPARARTRACGRRACAAPASCCAALATRRSRARSPSASSTSCSRRSTLGRPVQRERELHAQAAAQARRSSAALHRRRRARRASRRASASSSMRDELGVDDAAARTRGSVLASAVCARRSGIVEPARVLDAPRAARAARRRRRRRACSASPSPWCSSHERRSSAGSDAGDVDRALVQRAPPPRRRTARRPAARRAPRSRPRARRRPRSRACRKWWAISARCGSRSSP